MSAAHTRAQSRLRLRRTLDAAQWVSITAPATGIIGGIVAFGEGVPAAGLSLIAGSVLAGSIGFTLCCWARAWLLELVPIEPPADHP